MGRSERSGPPQDWRPFLGRKVSLRYALRGDPEYPLSEAIGVVASVGRDDDGIERVNLFTRKGSQVSVPVRDILAAKFFPTA